jgi:hypothetical protein
MSPLPGSYRESDKQLLREPVLIQPSMVFSSDNTGLRSPIAGTQSKPCRQNSKINEKSHFTQDQWSRLSALETALVPSFRECCCPFEPRPCALNLGVWIRQLNAEGLPADFAESTNGGFGSDQLLLLDKRNEKESDQSAESWRLVCCESGHRGFS